MDIHLSKQQYRLLVDLVYIGNWVLNSTRGMDRISDYDKIESLIFSHAKTQGMASLARSSREGIVPSNEFEEGGIHQAIAQYEEIVFYDILAQFLAQRDMGEDLETLEQDPMAMLRYVKAMESYAQEFQLFGTDRLYVVEEE